MVGGNWKWAPTRERCEKSIKIDDLDFLNRWCHVAIRKLWVFFSFPFSYYYYICFTRSRLLLLFLRLMFFFFTFYYVYFAVIAYKYTNITCAIFSCAWQSHPQMKGMKCFIRYISGYGIILLWLWRKKKKYLKLDDHQQINFQIDVNANELQIIGVVSIFVLIFAWFISKATTTLIISNGVMLSMGCTGALMDSDSIPMRIVHQFNYNETIIIRCY